MLFFLTLFTENALGASISITPTQGPAGTGVTVHGSQWPPGDLVHLSWNFPPFVTVASVRADGGGAFTTSIAVPEGAPIGPTQVNAINEAGNLTWQAPFTVTTPPTTPPAPPRLGADSIRSVFTTDENFNNKIVFMPGDRINYHVDVDNNTGSEIPIDVRFQAFPIIGFNPNLYSYDSTEHVDKMPVALTCFYSPTSLPSSDLIVSDYIVRISVTPSDSPNPAVDGDWGESRFTIQLTTPSPPAPPAPEPPPPPPTPLADLSPTAILFNSADLVPGRTVFFGSGVQNSASQSTGVFNERWFVDGVSVRYNGHASVPPNSTVLNANGQFQWVATTGTHTIGFAVDVDNQVLESNESNNSRFVTFTVIAPPAPPPPPPPPTSPPPPLTTVILKRALTRNGVGEFGQDQTHFIPGEVIRYAAIVNNRGSRAVTRRFDFRARSGSREIFSRTRAVSIRPGRSRLSPRAKPVPIATPVGTYTLRVTMTDNGQTSTKESLFTVATARPQGKAPNLIVLVHGCCTNAEKVSEWHTLRNTIINSLKQRYGKKRDWKKDWEIVVWDWNNYTTPTTDNYALCPTCFLNDANTAYDNARDQPGQPGQGSKLAGAINSYSTYKYIHLIAHSAGAKLIDEAASKIALNNTGQPFLHITFLDAYTQDDNDNNNYGGLPIHYPHYAEHYVHIGLASTDACLVNAFNFNITDWVPDKDDRPLEFGHQWPRRWYEKSITFSPVDLTTPGFTYGYLLSFEGGNNQFNALDLDYPPGQQCPVFVEGAKCEPVACPSPGRF